MLFEDKRNLAAVMEEQEDLDRAVRTYAENAVRAGAEWFDTVAPGWFDRVNANHLNVDGGDRCPLAQVLGEERGWIAGRNRAAKIVGFDPWSQTSRDWQASHGFNSWSYAHGVPTQAYTPWSLLTALWVAAVQERRTAG